MITKSRWIWGAYADNNTNNVFIAFMFIIVSKYFYEFYYSKSMRKKKSKWYDFTCVNSKNVFYRFSEQ